MFILPLPKYVIQNEDGKSTNMNQFEVIVRVDNTCTAVLYSILITSN